jgi:LEA14-like dessication related protein
MNANPIPDVLNELKLPVQLSNVQIAKESVVALITVLLGRLEETF